MHQYVERVVDLTEPAMNRTTNMSVEQARERVLSGQGALVREIGGSYALLAREGSTVRMARSLDRPLRYFLAKRQEGPALFVADRMDRILRALEEEGLEDQFHPSYTRMVPAHHIVELQLIGCPDPDPVYTRFFQPPMGTLPADLDIIGERYISALAREIRLWLQCVPENEPLGVSFSGGIDSGSVFVVTEHVLREMGMSPARLKAFTLNFGQGPDAQQARDFLDALGMGFYLETVPGEPDALDVRETIAILEDYKPLDVECAAMGLALCRGIRRRYPDWKLLLDGDGGDENLKDYPIEENPELTIRSVVQNSMLYQEGWGVGKIKHSLTYSGGLSRSYTRTYGPARHYGFEGFSPYTRPGVLEVAEAIPFIELTQFDISKLYALKGEVVRRGVLAVTGREMPVFEKRRFQHGALAVSELREHIPHQERTLRRQFLELYA